MRIVVLWSVPVNSNLEFLWVSVHCQFLLLVLPHVVVAHHVPGYVLELVFKKSFAATMIISSSGKDFHLFLQASGDTSKLGSS